MKFAHFPAGQFHKTVVKVVSVWRSKEIFPADLLDAIQEAVQAADILGVANVKLHDADEARRLIAATENLRRKQKEEKLESQLRPFGEREEFDDLWDADLDELNPGGLSSTLLDPLTTPKSESDLAKLEVEVPSSKSKAAPTTIQSPAPSSRGEARASGSSTSSNKSSSDHGRGKDQKRERSPKREKKEHSDSGSAGPKKKPKSQTGDHFYVVFEVCCSLPLLFPLFH